MSRRFGAVSLTIYIIQNFIFHLTSLVLNAMAGYIPPFCFGPMYTKESACGIARSAGSATLNVGVVILYIGVNLIFFSMFVWVWQKYHFIGSFEWFIQKVLTVARGTPSTTITLHMQHYRGGDCACRGIYSKDCCHLYRFCCGACENRSGSSQSSGKSSEKSGSEGSGSGSGDQASGGNAGAGGPGGIDVCEEEVDEVECTGSVGTWGCRAGVLTSLIILGIMGGAQ